MALLRRSTPSADVDTAPGRGTADDGLALLDWATLRDEVDSDPLVEEATERLRAALTVLEPRDEWGRPIAWRQVARIALGPLVTQLRDSLTANRLLDATRPAPAAAATDLFATTEAPGSESTDKAAGGDGVLRLPTPVEMPFWPA